MNWIFSRVWLPSTRKKCKLCIIFTVYCHGAAKKFVGLVFIDFLEIYFTTNSHRCPSHIQNCAQIKGNNFGIESIFSRINKTIYHFGSFVPFWFENHFLLAGQSEQQFQLSSFWRIPSGDYFFIPESIEQLTHCCVGSRKQIIGTWPLQNKEINQFFFWLKIDVETNQNIWSILEKKTIRFCKLFFLHFFFFFFDFLNHNWYSFNLIEHSIEPTYPIRDVPN